MTLFTAQDYARLSSLCFRPDYPGYTPGVVEAPDGLAEYVDTGKRYAHVATKYLPWEPDSAGVTLNVARRFYLERAWFEARCVAASLSVPQAFFPSLQHSALRVLQYAPGTGGHLHTDISLFTLNLYRSTPNPGLGGAAYHIGKLGELLGLGPAEPHRVYPLPVQQDSIVFFAIPYHAAHLPDGGTVGAWIAEQMKTMRYNKEAK
jgi:hypothetical protein